MKQLLYSLLLLVVAAACKKKTATEPTRSFYMGVTPWPADFTLQDVDTAYQFINQHCDLVAHHFDEGIPYQEAFTNSNWPADLLADINYRKNNVQPGKKILLSCSALDLTRKQKATYSSHAKNVSAATKQQWEQLPFNDSRIVTAYVNFLHLLIKELQPSFINYAVESNVDTWNSNDFLLYKEFISNVYLQLKTAYPQIPVFVSVITNEEPAAFNFAKALMPYSDYVALSAYPYTHISSSVNGNTNPALFPQNYFTNYIMLDVNKPLCFAETAYIAENLVVPSFNLNKTATLNWQQDYLDVVCNLLNSRRGKFLVWFCSKDYNAGNNRLRTLGLYQDLFALWENTGFIDENGHKRPVFTSWKQWMQRKHSD